MCKSGPLFHCLNGAEVDNAFKATPSVRIIIHINDLEIRRLELKYISVCEHHAIQLVPFNSSPLKNNSYQEKSACLI